MYLDTGTVLEAIINFLTSKGLSDIPDGLSIIVYGSLRLSIIVYDSLRLSLIVSDCLKTV